MRHPQGDGFFNYDITVFSLFWESSFADKDTKYKQQENINSETKFLEVSFAQKTDIEIQSREKYAWRVSLITEAPRIQ